MQVIYLHMPEIPTTRHIIAGDRHIINTAAADNNVYVKTNISTEIKLDKKPPREERGGVV